MKEPESPVGEAEAPKLEEEVSLGDVYLALGGLLIAAGPTEATLIVADVGDGKITIEE